MSDPERVEQVIARLEREIEPEFYQANRDRILFAVAVDSIECWLLPMLYDDNRAEKTTGCEESANRALRSENRNALSAGKRKFVRAYEEASSEYRKRKTLMKLGPKNPSLKLFIRQLDALQERLTAERGAAAGGQGGAADEETPGKAATDERG